MMGHATVGVHPHGPLQGHARRATRLGSVREAWWRRPQQVLVAVHLLVVPRVALDVVHALAPAVPGLAAADEARRPRTVPQPRDMLRGRWRGVRWERRN